MVSRGRGNRVILFGFPLLITGKVWQAIGCEGPRATHRLGSMLGHPSCCLVVISTDLPPLLTLPPDRRQPESRPPRTIPVCTRLSCLAGFRGPGVQHMDMLHVGVLHVPPWPPQARQATRVSLRWSRHPNHQRVFTRPCALFRWELIK
jgi:hypothetical protein